MNDRRSSALPLRIEAVGPELLKRLTRSPPTGFAASGGWAQDIGQDCLHQLSHLVVFTDPPIFIGGDPVNVGDRDELFRIALVDFEPSLHQPPGVRPALPIGGRAGGDLEPFVGQPLEGALFQSESEYLTTEGRAYAVVDVGILLRTPSGAEMLIETYHDTLAHLPRLVSLDLVFTTDGPSIARRVASGTLRSA
jgi:hypothetical protein